jgi:hypothetical protein
MTADSLNINTLPAAVNSPADYAGLGGLLAAGGYTATQISEIMGLVERSSFNAAQRASREVALAVVERMAVTLQSVHRNAALEVWRQISNRTGGWGGVTVHRECANIALRVANSAPNTTYVQDAIIGSVQS